MLSVLSTDTSALKRKVWLTEIKAALRPSTMPENWSLEVATWRSLMIFESSFEEALGRKFWSQWECWQGGRGITKVEKSVRKADRGWEWRDQTHVIICVVTNFPCWPHTVKFLGKSEGMLNHLFSQWLALNHFIKICVAFIRNQFCTSLLSLLKIHLAKRNTNPL